MKIFHVAKRIFPFAAFFLVLLSLQICRADGGKPTVFVSIDPIKYLVEKIGGERIEVQVMVQPGASPDTYEPKPMQMVKLSKAAVYFSIGLPFEKAWLPRIAESNQRMLIEKLDADIPKIPMAEGHSHHAEQEDHKEGNIEEDPHLWLSPPIVLQMIPKITAALIRIDPAQADLYSSRSKRLTEDIGLLHEELSNLLKDHQGLHFMVFHPAWGYFAQAYGLHQLPIEVEGKNPKPAELQALISFARSKSIRVIFVQPQISAKSVRAIAAEIGAQVVELDPLAQDWQANLRQAAEAFTAALK